MKQTALILAALLVSTMALAISIDAECREFGYSDGLAKYEWNDNLGWVLAEGDGSSLTLNGDDTSITWSGAEALVVKAGNTVHFIDTSGLVNQTKPNLSHLTFCDDGQEEVPEFGVIGAGLVLAGAGIVIARKRK